MRRNDIKPGDEANCYSGMLMCQMNDVYTEVA